MAKKTKYNVSKLLEDGLIRKIPPSSEKAKESVRTAESWIKEAENNFRSKAFRSCIISGYLAMFHSVTADKITRERIQGIRHTEYTTILPLENPSVPCQGLTPPIH
jgi:hypothetical protein